jgi:mRNA-degrading endonuclease RelE of RelBE toxin-antitoxin system
LTPSNWFTVRLTRHAERDPKSLRSWKPEVHKKINQLEEDAYAGHALTGNLRGSRALAFNLKGSGAFRALYYLITDDRICLVYLIAPHENVYREVERRIQALRRTGEISAEE